MHVPSPYHVRSERTNQKSIFSYEKMIFMKNPADIDMLTQKSVPYQKMNKNLEFGIERVNTHVFRSNKTCKFLSVELSNRSTTHDHN